ncbi:MAG TPA: hypothetical protein VEC09_03950, partial [Actinomycetota bacterium]|nr:hypothetical protein [Actinomycetota bacterium]
MTTAILVLTLGIEAAAASQARPLSSAGCSVGYLAVAVDPDDIRADVPYDLFQIYLHADKAALLVRTYDCAALDVGGELRPVKM